MKKENARKSRCKKKINTKYQIYTLERYEHPLEKYEHPVPTFGCIINKSIWLLKTLCDIFYFISIGNRLVSLKN